MRFSLLISLVALLFSSWAHANSDEFPGRKEFPEVKIYTKDHLKSNFGDVLIIDTRSNYEFETIHINTAINIPVSDKDFVQQIQKVRQTTQKAIVFYCNGRTCYKSYKATKAALKSHVRNVYAYDAGMFEWAKTYPELTTLLGKTPINPNDLLSKKTLKAHMITPHKFTSMAYEQNDATQIIDIRDLSQRASSVGYFVGMEHWVSINRKAKLKKLIRKAKKNNKTLLIYDAVGKQVRWLQYTLEQENLDNYFFMEKGARGFFNEIINAKR